jgi:hypothetical protein
VPIRASRIQIARAVPLLALVVVASVMSRTFADTQSSASTDDVDVLVISPSAIGLIPPEGPAPRGVVESPIVHATRFAFTGWTDLPAGASLVLVTSPGPSGSDIRIHVRSMRRRDVAGARQDPTLLYAGFSFAGQVSEWGTPRCLYFRTTTSARLVWQSSPDNCRLRISMATG